APPPGPKAAGGGVRARVPAGAAGRRGVREPRDARARSLGDSPAARVEGEAAAPAAPAEPAVELHGRVAQLAAEPRRAAHDPPVEHDPGAEARAGRQHDQRAGAPAGAEPPP